METVVQIAAVCLAAAILGAVLRQHSPETAAVLVSLPLVRAAWELLRTLV